jgi:uncharacterized protein (DUF983 family)
MALENCPECETQVSSTAKACPKCGHDFNALNPGQHRIALIFIVTILVIVLLIFLRKLIVTFM